MTTPQRATAAANPHIINPGDRLSIAFTGTYRSSHPIDQRAILVSADTEAAHREYVVPVSALRSAGAIDVSEDAYTAAIAAGRDAHDNSHQPGHFDCCHSYSEMFETIRAGVSAAAPVLTVEQDVEIAQLRAREAAWQEYARTLADRLSDIWALVEGPASKGNALEHRDAVAITEMTYHPEKPELLREPAATDEGQPTEAPSD
ncbi:hypothetical protein [Umezawaea tangerina]|uniref:Uncharacterized protein n=1 Tax=Umezawaea tangerina TaxID=84725 RepID=A0A2T0SPF2_9PSEU|nr:hypothetical protein [Umezawaea tangerina]PRY35302.1 hypothetical protein CLV43_114220 [Umezawaea tangerina]